jgi:hypothetical protein
MIFQSCYIAGENAPLVLAASATYTTDTTTTAVFTGQGKMWVEIVVTAYTGGSGVENVEIWVERNTVANTVDWVPLGNITLGDAAGIGMAMTTGTFRKLIYNTGDYQLRLNVQPYGSASSVTFSANIYPVLE